MTQDEIIEMAIQGHASTRDAIRWAINQEREACAKVCDGCAKGWKENPGADDSGYIALANAARFIRARGEA